MIWEISNRADPRARVLADRHYNRQKVGSPQFVPPGRCAVFYADNEAGKAFWVTSWPFAEYTKHAWAGAWVCSAFRNEGAGIASGMIVEALAATKAFFGEPPELGMITFLDRRKVHPIMKRGKPHFGYTWELAGFRHVGFTKGGLMAFQCLPEDMPSPAAAVGAQSRLAA